MRVLVFSYKMRGKSALIHFPFRCTGGPFAPSREINDLTRKVDDVMRFRLTSRSRAPLPSCQFLCQTKNFFGDFMEERSFLYPNLIFMLKNQILQAKQSLPISGLPFLVPLPSQKNGRPHTNAIVSIYNITRQSILYGALLLI